MRRYRCKLCGHRPRRVVSLTVKQRLGRETEPRQHKKACDCACHQKVAS